MSKGPREEPAHYTAESRTNCEATEGASQRHSAKQEPSSKRGAPCPEHGPQRSSNREEHGLVETTEVPRKHQADSEGNGSGDAAEDRTGRCKAERHCEDAARAVSSYRQGTA